MISLALFVGTGAASAQGVELTTLNATRSDEGVLVDFATRFTLPKSVEDALAKAVPLHFVAEAELFRYRWYWRDRSIARTTRTWRIAYQPLTLNYRVSFGPLAQTYPTLAEGLASVRRSARWRIAEPIPPDDDGRWYVEFNYRLDTTLLPRPLQIGLGGQPDWQLSVERSVAVEAR